MPITRRDGLTITLELGFSTNTAGFGIWDSSAWNAATWGPDVVWTDVTRRLRSWRTQTGKQRELGAYEAGRATFVLNNRDAALSPTNLAGPYVSGGITQIRPWVPVRFSTTWAGVLYRVWTGYVISWVEDTPGDVDYLSSLQCVDELAMLARNVMVAGPSVGALEPSGWRVHRILNAANNHAPRDIDSGQNQCQATTLTGQALSQIQDVCNSEYGAVYVDTDGTIVFDGLARLEARTTSRVSQALFGDGGGTELPYQALTPAFDGDLVANIVNRQAAGGVLQTVADPTSRAVNGDQADTLTNLVTYSDAQVLATTQAILAHRKNAESRFTNMTVIPKRAPAVLYPQVFGRGIRDRITIRRRPNSTINELITKDVFIEGIVHSGSAAADSWQTDYQLSSASTFATSLAQWDSAVWDNAQWFY